MSHFTVTVIGDDVEEQLAPYQENNEGTCPKEYLEFNETETEYFEKYQNDTAKGFYPEDITLTEEQYNLLVEKRSAELTNVKLDWDCKYIFDVYHRYPIIFRTQYFSQKELDAGKKVLYFAITEVEKVDDNTANFTATIIAEPEEIPVKQIYSTFEEYMEKYCGNDSRDEETCKYGYWENPNAEWDWYQIGGRWQGMLKLKEGADGKIGRKSLLDEDQTYKENKVDQAKMKDIDWDGMKAEAETEAIERYDYVGKFVDLKQPHLKWSQVRDGEQFKDKSIDEKREFYHAQPAVIQWGEARKAEYGKELSSQLKDLFVWGELDDYMVSKEAYIERARKKSVMTFAVLKDGKWYERGDMGWWGVVSDEKDETEWENEFNKLIEGLDPETLITIVDCHI